MKNDIKMPRWGQYAAGGLMLGAAMTAGTLGLVLNVSHGLEAGIAAGIAFGLADGAKVLVPVVAGIIGWSRQMKLTAAICVAVSLWSAASVYLDGAGSALLAKQHGAESYADKAKAIAELESEAARLDALAGKEALKGGCKANCRALTEQASAARQRLQSARSAREQAKPVEISGMAAMIAMASGADTNGIARGIGVVKALLFLVLIEVLVWLSVPAMALLTMAKPSTTEDHEMTPVAIATPAKPIAKSASGTKNYYLSRLERDHPEIAKRVESGELSVYAASLAAGLRKTPAKSAKWTKADAYLELNKASA